MSPDLLLAAILVPLLVLAGAGLLVLLGRRGNSPALRHLEAGAFSEALADADLGDGASRDDLLAAGVAARHRLHLDDSRAALERLVGDHPDDGEGWLELALTAATRGDDSRAEEAFHRCRGLRSDLEEPLTLHRAWHCLRRGDADAARRRFEEVEVTIESKLRHDVGGGDPLYAESFAHLALLWRAAGDDRRSAWARDTALAAAPRSRLIAQLLSEPRPTV